jgi:hypothetical protein
MFGLPLDKITFEDIDAFCRSGVREGILLDFKRDFPARLEKSIAAFANTFGGMILIGVDETPTGEAALPISGVPLVSGLRERVIRIGLDAIYPPVIPEVKVIGFKTNGELGENDRAIVVVRVHESENGGHAIDKRTTVYLRVENVSDPFRKASVDELEWFINKREKAIQEKNRILDRARERAKRYLIRLRTQRRMSTREPAAKCVFWTIPRFPREPLTSPRDLLKLGYELRLNLDHHKHLFPLGSSHPMREGIFFDGEYYSKYRYSEFQQQGLVYHEYGFWWDSDETYRGLVLPGNIVELLFATVCLGSALYSKIGYWGLVDVEFSLVGIGGMKFHEAGALILPDPGTEVSDDPITVRESASVSELTSNSIGLVKRMMLDISWAFGELNCPSSVEDFLANPTVSVQGPTL